MRSGQGSDAMKIDREELRKLVREALREALGGAGTTTSRSGAPAAVRSAEPPGQGDFQRQLRNAVARGKPAEITIAARSREDLDRFAREIATASAEPDIRAAILAGTIGFLPIGPAGPAAAPASPVAPPARTATGAAYEMKSGVLSEMKLVEIARTHKRIAVGADVVLTPLARDKARELKVELTRQKP